MVSQPRARKRVHSIPRGPDGSAFQKCEKCGLLVAIALTDMHECEIKKLSTKKLKSQFGIRNSNGLKIQYQPRSAFRLFIEKLLSTSKDGNEIEVDRKGFDIWKKMSKEERIPFVLQAEKINSAYVKLLLEEENEIEWVDDEADSAEIGRRHDKVRFPPCFEFELWLTLLLNYVRLDHRTMTSLRCITILKDPVDFISSGLNH
ncbi:Hypothetical predicted protein [Olea europaea subsp. europaea]|uniref:HMG box domain-containing protein n=1 Tax=Olea europaea subsp. europaea TaxID=158383 RepID=A0A8S0RHN6_OLEEU|nr:Hypothetical predicted protein [Olea europaea subsp. europaea]